MQDLMEKVMTLKDFELLKCHNYGAVQISINNNKIISLLIDFSFILNIDDIKVYFKNKYVGRVFVMRITKDNYLVFGVEFHEELPIEKFYTQLVFSLNFTDNISRINISEIKKHPIIFK